MSSSFIPSQFNRGRPRKGKELNKEPWDPQKWKPKHDFIVALYLRGLKNAEIAEKLNTSPEHVYLVLNSPKARKIIEEASSKFRRQYVDTIPDRLNALAERAVDNMSYVLFNPELREKSPLGVFDRSVQVLQAVGKITKTPLPGSTTINNTQINQVNIPQEAASKFLQGIKVSEQYAAERLLPAPQVDTEIK